MSDGHYPVRPYDLSKSLPKDALPIPERHEQNATNVRLKIDSKTYREEEIEEVILPDEILFGQGHETRGAPLKWYHRLFGLRPNGGLSLKRIEELKMKSMCMFSFVVATTVLNELCNSYRFRSSQFWITN